MAQYIATSFMGMEGLGWDSNTEQLKASKLCTLTLVWKWKIFRVGVRDRKGPVDPRENSRLLSRIPRTS